MYFKFTLFFSIFLISQISKNEGILPSKSEIDEILGVHNTFRANVKPASNSMMLLTWHPEGAKKAEIMANKCIFDHDKSEDRVTTEFPDGGGQNLFATDDIKFAPWSAAIQAWQSEVSLFEFGKDKGNFEEVGHYTQVVWGATRKIGCARSNCTDLKIYTCNYYPHGNLFPYYIPYRKAPIQSCKGCLSNMTCVSKGPYAGKLLEKCDLFCQDKFSNCASLAKRNLCSFVKNECALSCRSECKTL